MKNSSMELLWQSSHISGGNATYVEDLYESYLKDPNGVAEQWRDYFDKLPLVESSVPHIQDVPHSTIRERFAQISKMRVRTEATVHNGMLDGPSTMYYENGDKMSEAIYKAGLLDGLATAYYEDGKIKATAGYRQGLLHGESATWSKDGLSVKKVNFDSGRIVE